MAIKLSNDVRRRSLKLRRRRSIGSNFAEANEYLRCAFVIVNYMREAQIRTSSIADTRTNVSPLVLHNRRNAADVNRSARGVLRQTATVGGWPAKTRRMQFLGRYPNGAATGDAG